MAGYHDFSMSNNAIAAYEDGLVPASKIPGIPASLVKEYCWPKEWHHCSKNYNRVDFFDPAEVRAIFGLEESEDYEVNEEAVEALANYKKQKKEQPVVYKNCKVEWLDWSGGTLKRPVAEEMIELGCTVSVKGQTATITLPNGRTLIKRLKTRGFSFREVPIK